MMATSSILLLISSALAAPEPAESNFALRSDDRVVFLGDTLTEGEFDSRSQTNRPTYAAYVETFVRVRYPHLKTAFLNAGWVSDTAQKGASRLKRDVLALNPTVVVVCYGLFDAQQKAYDKELHDRYREEMTKIVKQLLDAKCRVWLITAPSVDEHRNARLKKAEYNSVLARYAETVRQIGKQFNVPVVDWFAEMTRQREARLKGNSRFAFSRFGGLLPEAMGHMVGAVELLKAWDVEPLVAEIHLDWKNKAARGTHGKISAKAGASPQEIELQLTGCPMPWPVDSTRGVAITQDWPGTDLIKILLYAAEAPDRITISASRGARSRVKLPVLKAQLVQGFNLAINAPVNSANELMELWRYVNIKNAVRRRRWRDEEGRRPDSPELLVAHKKLMESYDAYHEGYRMIIDRLPRTLDMTLTLAEMAKPTTRRVPPRVPPRRPIPTTRAIRPAQPSVTTRPVRPLRLRPEAKPATPASRPAE